jgi:hypothetical protein
MAGFRLIEILMVPPLCADSTTAQVSRRPIQAQFFRTFALRYALGLNPSSFLLEGAAMVWGHRQSGS